MCHHASRNQSNALRCRKHGKTQRPDPNDLQERFSKIELLRGQSENDLEGYLYKPSFADTYLLDHIHRDQHFQLGVLYFDHTFDSIEDEIIQ
jgi:hypothetical protein